MIKSIDCLGSRIFFGGILRMKARKHNINNKYFLNAIVEDATSTLREFNLRKITYKTRYDIIFA